MGWSSDGKEGGSDGKENSKDGGDDTDSKFIDMWESFNEEARIERKDYSSLFVF